MTPELLYCGHSAVIITTESGKRIAIDPFLSGNPLCPKELHDPGKLDLIALTHGHGDHTGDVLALAHKYHCKIAATYELAALLAHDGVKEEHLLFMNKGGSVSVPHGNGIAVSLTNAFHSSSYTTKDGKNHYAGEPCGVVIRLESGKTIYHAGDTSLFSDMSLIREEHTPAVALFPIGDCFTMGPREAAKAVELVKPRVAIPIHYGTFPPLTGTPEQFREAVTTAGTEVVCLKPGERLKVG